MQDLIDNQLEAMVSSQEQLARTLQAESVIVTRMARMLQRIEPGELTLLPGQAYAEAEFLVVREIGSYLHALADFEEALAEHVKFAIQELRVTEEE